MPTVAEIKAELKRLKIKGVTGKKKAELLAMLPAESCMRAVAPKRSKAPARSPSPEPVSIKAPTPRKVVGRAVVTPARVAMKTIEKPAFVERKIPGKKIKALPKLVIKKTEKKHKINNIEDALNKILILNGYDEDEGESDYEFMEGFEDQYADAVIEVMQKDNWTIKQIASQAAEMDEGYTMFDDFILENNPVAWKRRKEMRGE
jgi:hypothetical protein